MSFADFKHDKKHAAPVLPTRCLAAAVPAHTLHLTRPIYGLLTLFGMASMNIVDDRLLTWLTINDPSDEPTPLWLRQFGFDAASVIYAPVVFSNGCDRHRSEPKAGLFWGISPTDSEND
jgi:hypothetical protein